MFRWHKTFKGRREVVDAEVFVVNRIFDNVAKMYMILVYESWMSDEWLRSHWGLQIDCASNFHGIIPILAIYSITTLPQSLYSHKLSPTDINLFQRLKISLKENRFEYLVSCRKTLRACVLNSIPIQDPSRRALMGGRVVGNGVLMQDGAVLKINMYL